MAITSSGRSKLPERSSRIAPRIGGVVTAAVASAAAAAWFAWNYQDASPPGSRLRPAANVIERAAFTSSSFAPSSTHPFVSATAQRSSRPAYSASLESLEHALADADPGKRDLILGEMLARLVNEDAQVAARFAELQREPFLREIALRAVAQQWARLDPDSACEWAVSLADAAESDAAIVNVAIEVAASDPHGAMLLLEQRIRGGVPFSAFEGVIHRWATSDYHAAQAWLDARPPGEIRDQLLQRLVFLRSTVDPSGAAHLANRTITGDANRIEALASIAHAWDSKDPAAARQWAGSLDARTLQRVQAELSPRDEP